MPAPTVVFVIRSTERPAEIPVFAIWLEHDGVTELDAADANVIEL